MSGPLAPLGALAGLYRHLGPHRRRLWTLLAVDAAVAVWGVVTFLAASTLVYGVVGLGGGAPTAGAGGFGLSGILPQLSREQRVLVGLAATVGALVVGSALRLGVLALRTGYLTRILVHLQTECFARALRYRMEYQDEARRAQLTQLVIVETRSCYSLLKECSTLSGHGLLAAILLGLMAGLSPVLTLAFLAIGLTAWSLTTRLNAVSRRRSTTGLAERHALMSVTQEAFWGIRQVKLLDRAEAFRAAFEARASAAGRLLASVGVAVSGQAAIVYAGGLLGVGTLVGTSLVLPHVVAPASAVLFVFAAVQLVGPLGSAARAWGSLVEQVPPARSVLAFLAQDAGAREEGGGLERARLFERSLTFEGVGLAYPGRPPALADIELEIRRGERVGIVGASGSGKTSLVALVPRLYDPTVGRVAADGTDLREFSLAWLRRRVALLSQDVFLFNTTIRENIRMGRPDATEADILEAARRAHVEEFAAGLPDGYDTVVGERGGRLSGGQRQRVALAQVFLRDPELLILDEATSALDPESEAVIRAAVEELGAGRTVLVVAHRPAMLRGVDRVVVLDGGRVVEAGSPEALARGQGPFARMWEVQVGARG